MALHKLAHADGTAVTAQEAYDAFMNTRVLIVENDTTYEAISMVWYDNNSKRDDPTNVGYVKLYYLKSESSPLQSYSVFVGDSSLVPAQQG